MKNLNVELTAGGISANYSFDTYEEPFFGVPQTINYLDRSAFVAVTNMSYSGKAGDRHSERLFQCQGVDYSYALYNKRITYRLDWQNVDGRWAKPLLRQHLQAIADEMGLFLNWIGGMNYLVPCNEPLKVENKGTDYETRYEEHTGTAGELIDRLVSWSRDIPTLQYSVRIWGQALNVVQRGYESQIVDLDTEGKIVRNPIYTSQQIFTAWDDYTQEDSYIYSSDNSLTKEPFTGSISYGGNELIYEDGYLKTETHRTDDTEVITTNFTYGDVDPHDTTENAKYLLKKEVIEADSKVVTDYTYFKTANEVYLGEELETHYVDNMIDSQILTVHSPLGNGWYGTTVYDKTDNNEVLNTSLGQGAPGGKVSQYMVDIQQEGLTNNSDIDQRRALISGISRMRSTYPVYDIGSLMEIAREIDRLNRKTQYTAQLDVLGIDIALDTDRKIILDGYSWFVESNSIEITPMHKMQRLKLVRWG